MGDEAPELVVFSLCSGQSLLKRFDVLFEGFLFGIKFLCAYFFTHHSPPPCWAHQFRTWLLVDSDRIIREVRISETMSSIVDLSARITTA